MGIESLNGMFSPEMWDEEPAEEEPVEAEEAAVESFLQRALKRPEVVEQLGKYRTIK